MKSVNLDLLNNPGSAEFIEELENAENSLMPKQAKAFFTKIFDAFDKEIPLNVSKFVIKVISQIIEDETIFSVFVSGGFAAKLPFNNKGLRRPLCDFIYTLIMKDINSIDADVAANMTELINFEPSKFLTLIAYYSESFDEADDPWPMLDLLFTNSEPFEEPDIAEDYISLLTHLIQTYKTFRRERIRHTWKRVTKLLASEDLNTVKMCYLALIEISKYYDQGKINVAYIKQHLKYEELHSTILSFILLAKIDPINYSKPVILNSLIQMATHDINATLVLLQLSTSPDIAQSLATINNWPLKKLPTINDTFRLVLMVVKNKAARKLLYKTEEFCQFLTNISKTRNSNTLSAVCMLIRRLPTTPEFVQNLSESGFIDTFYTSCESSGDEISMHAFLLLTDRLLDGGYAKEFIDACDLVCELIKGESNLIEPAAYLAVNLAEHKRCRRRLMENGIDQFFEANAKSGPLKKVSRQFLSLIQN